MKNKTKKRFYILLTILIIVIITISLGLPPRQWQTNNILNKKRTDIHNIIGKPSCPDLWDVKGDIWEKDFYIGWYRLIIIYNSSDSVSKGVIKTIYIGTKENYSHWNYCSEFNE